MMFCQVRYPVWTTGEEAAEPAGVFDAAEARMEENGQAAETRRM